MEDELTKALVPLEGSAESLEQALIARIPLLAGTDRKAKYLAYRSTGFTPTQAAQLAGTSLQAVKRWRKQDAVFKHLEGDMLGELQAQIGNEVVRLEFLRNLRMLLAKDSQLIFRFFKNPEGLSPREWDYFKLIRKHYTPGDMLALEKILNPERHVGQVKIQLTWGANVNPGEDEPEVEGVYSEVA